MADGAIQGRLAAIGQVAHTGATATVVATKTLPSSADGVYHVIARVTGSTATHTNSVWSIAHAHVWVDGGAATASATTESRGDATGYVIAITTSGLDVRVSVTAANGHRSVATLEIFGVEMVLTIA